jgi:hypothetical protein
MLDLSLWRFQPIEAAPVTIEFAPAMAPAPPKPVAPEEKYAAPSDAEFRRMPARP